MPAGLLRGSCGGFKCDGHASLGRQRDRVEHLEHPHRIVASHSRWPRLPYGTGKFGQLGDAAAVDRQRRLGHNARCLELRNPARMDTESIVGPPLGTHAAIRPDGFNIVVDVEYDLRTIEMGDQPALEPQGDDRSQVDSGLIPALDFGKDTLDPPTEQPVQLIHQVRADPEQLSTPARPRLSPATELEGTTLDRK